MKLLASDAMALAIDYQIRLLPSILDSDLLLKRSSILLEGLRLLNVPTLITQQYTRGLGMSHPSIFKSAGTDEYLEKITSAVTSRKISGRPFRIFTARKSSSAALKRISASCRPPWIFWRRDFP